MIRIKPIPLALDPAAFAAANGLPPDRAAVMIGRFSRMAEPAGVFDEVPPEAVLEAGTFLPDQWGKTVIAGLCSLGPGVLEATHEPDRDGLAWAGLVSLALRDALDFLEYRVRLFLKPAGQTPGPRVVPGCDELPLAAARRILDLFGPDERFGLTAGPSGAIDSPAGLAFVYPTAQGLGRTACANCKNRSCPVRLA